MALLGYALKGYVYATMLNITRLIPSSESVGLVSAAGGGHCQGGGNG